MHNFGAKYGGLRLRIAISLVLIAGLSLTMLSATAQPSDAAGEAIIPGELRVTSTLDNIGVVWFVNGDTDLDSSMTIDYRRAGESSWRSGAPAMRAEPTVTVDGNPLGINSWAASAMFLDRGTTYDIRAVLTDPDGGTATRVVQGTTRTLPEPGLTLRYVVPGPGGGTGTQTNPYQGLQAAANNAQPGDSFIVASGAYSPFELTTSGTAGNPISFVGPANGSAIVDGAGTDRGVITIGTFGGTTSHVIVSGLTIRNGTWGIDAQRTQNLVVADNIITDVGWGVYNRRDQNDERYQVICNNVIEGRVAWPATGIPGERGIDLRGWGNTVCNNEVSNFGDCVSVQPINGTSFGNDVFGNDANRCVDDGIEIDYNQANARVYRNRVTNSRIGVSVQPIRGGPAYILRNELFNLENSTIKLNNGPSGLFIAHNTGIKTDNGLEDGSVFNNAVFRNNLILGTRYAFEFTTSAPAGSRDFDFGAWGTSRTSGPWFKWDNDRYDRTSDLPAGTEDNGIDVGFGSIVDGSLPASWDVEVPVGSRDLRPTSGSALIDAGVSVANINRPFVSDGAPDAGAFESGKPLPIYGPRARLIAPPAEPSNLRCQGALATIVGTSGADNIVGTAGRDVIVTLGGNDVVDAGGGDDAVCTGGGDDEVLAGSGNDFVFAGTGDDEVRGGNGDDEVWGGPGNDIIIGGSGADDVRGGSGNDDIELHGASSVGRGGDGNDVMRGSLATMYGNAGDDTFELEHGAQAFGGPDNDNVTFVAGFAPPLTPSTASLGPGNDESLDQSQLANMVQGGSGDDRLEAVGSSQAARTMRGGGGNDWLIGGQGNDTMFGDNGDDLLEGRGGANVLRGGGGDDVVIGSDSGSELDVIRSGPDNDSCTAQGVVVESGTTFTVQVSTGGNATIFDCESGIEPATVYPLPGG